MENKGSLIEGYDADFTLVDLENRHTITDDDVWTRVGWTPYAGMELTGFPMYTIVDGITVHERTIGGALRGESKVKPGQTGRSLTFS
jgi:dihydroorotase